MKVKIYDGGYLPTRAHFDDAGLDLRTPEEFTLNAKESAVIDLCIAVQIPVGYYGELKSKSGLNVLHNIQSMGGVIDSSYRGSIKARITNNGDDAYTFHRGDKICQMVIMPCALLDVQQAAYLDESASGRENNGFGSSGR